MCHCLSLYVCVHISRRLLLSVECVCIRENGCNRFCSPSHNQISKDAQVLVIGNQLHSHTVLVNFLLDE